MKEKKIDIPSKIIKRLLKENRAFNVKTNYKWIWEEYFLQRFNHASFETILLNIPPLDEEFEKRLEVTTNLFNNNRIIEFRRSKLINFLNKFKSFDLYLRGLDKAFILRDIKETLGCEIGPKELISDMEPMEIILKYMPTNRFFYGAFLWASNIGHNFWRRINDEWLKPDNYKDMSDFVIDLYNKRELFNP